MKTSKTNLRAQHEAAFNKSIETAKNNKGKETDSSNTLPKFSVDDKDIDAARECYLDHLDLIEETTKAVNQVLNTQGLSERIESFGKNLTDKEFNEAGEQLVNDMTASGTFNTVFAMASSVGIKAIGIGVAGSFQLILAGAEKGYEGMLILPDNDYGIVTPNQFKTRSWGEITVGVDFLVSAGINLSFWYTEPESAGLTGIFADLVIGAGLRFTYIETCPIPDSMPTRPFSKPNGVFAGFSIRISIGLEIGGGVYYGVQKMPADSDIFPDRPDQTLMTLNLNNSVTGAANIQIGETAVLNAILMPPADGNNDPCQLTKDVTTMIIAMPDFISNSVTDPDTPMVVDINDWEITEGSPPLNFTYTGTSKTWDSNIEFTISDVKSNSGSGAQSGQVRIIVANNDTTWSTATGLSLVNLSYAATVTTWELTLGADSNCTIAAPPEGYPNDALPSTGSNVPAYLPNDTNGYTQLTQFIDSSGRNPTTWNVGVYFAQGTSDGNSVPMMQTIIWQDGVPLGSAQKYYGNPQKELNSQEQVLVPVYYGNNTTLTASALLTS